MARVGSVDFIPLEDEGPELENELGSTRLPFDDVNLDFDAFLAQDDDRVRFDGLPHWRIPTPPTPPPPPPPRLAQLPPSVPPAVAAPQPVHCSLLRRGPPPLIHGDMQPVAEDQCVERVLEILPKICEDHVRKLYNDKQPNLADARWLDDFIATLLEGGYPVKQGVKRKREAARDDAQDWVEFERPGRETPEGYVDYVKASRELLAKEFPNLKLKRVDENLATHRFLNKAYDALKADDHPQSPHRMKQKRKRLDPKTRIPSLSYLHPSVPGRVIAQTEMAAVKKKSEHEDAKQQAARLLAREEEANVRLARQANEMSECGCCCTDHPNNRMIKCTNPDPTCSHWVCYDCTKKFVESQIGELRHEIVCIHLDGCSSPVADSQLRLAVPLILLDRLAHLRQQAEISLAVDSGELEGLEECPFCDFKAVVPPFEIDREFRCQNDSCGITSCKKCKVETHVPLSCEEHAKEQRVDARHIVEEAMTNALVRACNKCKNKFVKSTGCNKMTCTSCGNKQCYVCSENVRDYTHFRTEMDLPPGTGAAALAENAKRCPLHDDTDARHDADVQKAEEEALRKVREDHPELTEGELKLQVSDAVKEAEELRRSRRAPVPGGMPEMDDAYRRFQQHGHIAPPHAPLPPFENIFPGDPPAMEPLGDFPRPRRRPYLLVGNRFWDRMHVPRHEINAGLREHREQREQRQRLRGAQMVLQRTQVDVQFQPNNNGNVDAPEPRNADVPDFFADERAWDQWLFDPHQPGAEGEMDLPQLYLLNLRREEARIQQARHLLWLRGGGAPREEAQPPPPGPAENEPAQRVPAFRGPRDRQRTHSTHSLRLFSAERPGLAGPPFHSLNGAGEGALPAPNPGLHPPARPERPLRPLPLFPPLLGDLDMDNGIKVLNASQ